MNEREALFGWGTGRWHDIKEITKDPVEDLRDYHGKRLSDPIEWRMKEVESDIEL